MICCFWGCSYPSAGEILPRILLDFFSRFRISSVQCLPLSLIDRRSTCKTKWYHAGHTKYAKTADTNRTKTRGKLGCLAHSAQQFGYTKAAILFLHPPFKVSPPQEHPALNNFFCTYLGNFEPKLLNILCSSRLGPNRPCSTCWLHHTPDPQLLCVRHRV